MGIVFLAGDCRETVAVLPQVTRANAVLEYLTFKNNRLLSIPYCLCEVVSDVERSKKILKILTFN